jgi:hypothetical protein
VEKESTVESERKEAAAVQASTTDPMLHQYSARSRTEELENQKKQLLSQIDALKTTLLSENKEVIENAVLQIESLQKQQNFNLQTELQPGKTVEAAINEAVGTHPLANRLKKVFAKDPLTPST